MALLEHLYVLPTIFINISIPSDSFVSPRRERIRQESPGAKVILARSLDRS